MPLLEVVTIEVGSAIAKSILKLWLNDSELGQDVSSSLIDLLKLKTSDLLAQRRGQRQFDTIGEMVGKSLIPLFAMEGKKIDEGTRTAVALAVAEAFNNSKLSSELLAKQNLDPTKLAKHILASYPTATQSFSAAETEFFKRIIYESCSYIVDIASQMPAFTEHTFAEILNREDQLIARCEQILQEVRRERELRNPEEEAEHFEIDYRRTVTRMLDELQLFGVDVSSFNRRYRLTVAYITLSVAHRSLRKSLSHSRKNTAQINASYNSVNLQDYNERSTVPVIQALARSRRLLIRGAAGSGKTTLLQWIAVKSASRSFEGLLSEWNDTFPFYIRLRHSIQLGLPRPEDFPGLVAPAIADTMPKGWAHSQLKSDHAIVLVDGLDEVPLLQREDVRVWLENLVDSFPHARFIITSRSHAVEDRWMDNIGFEDAEMQPMQMSDIYAFIDHWHEAIKEELSEEVQIAELEPMAEHLKKEIRRNRSYLSLATNPLLCAMLCALNRDRREQLPADRIELYEACCALLLERRDKERRIDLTDYPALTYRQKRVFLEDLAYWMIRNHLSEVSVVRADERFKQKLNEMPSRYREMPPSSIRRLFIERSGIIRELEKEQIDFAHRTFQEFFAAKAAIDERKIDLLVQNAHYDQWREVIILASGLAPKHIREEIIKGIISRGDNEKEYRYQLHLLAVACLETSVELGQEVTLEVEKRLSNIVPPKDMKDAQALSAAGELAVKHLTNADFSNTITAACVRTLALIGTDSAFEMLKEYARDDRTTVIDELLRIWDFFDRETYARDILAQTFRNRSELTLERLPTLEGIKYFTNLTSLILSNCPQIEDLHVLADLSSLTSLALLGCSRVRNISSLGNLTQLTSLTLTGSYNLIDLQSLASLTQLKYINLSEGPQVTDLRPLAALKQLTSVELSDCSQVKDLSPLANLRQLDFLSLSNCLEVNDLSPLANLINLFSLTITNSYVGNLSPLAGLIQLNWLNLANCSRITDLSPLTSLIQLNWLNLANCSRITDLSPLTGLIQLNWLNLANCSRIIDLNPLTKLDQLKELHLDGILEKVEFPTDIAEEALIFHYGFALKAKYLNSSAKVSHFYKKQNRTRNLLNKDNH